MCLMIADAADAADTAAAGEATARAARTQRRLAARRRRPYMYEYT